MIEQQKLGAGGGWATTIQHTQFDNLLVLIILSFLEIEDDRTSNISEHI